MMRDETFSIFILLAFLVGIALGGFLTAMIGGIFA